MIRAMLACVIFVSPVMADVIIVDGTGGGDYTGIQPALDNSTDEDLILVKPGLYDGFELTNRSARIVGIGSPGFSSKANVHDIAADQSVVLAGLRMGGSNILTITNCAGAIRVQDCEVVGGGSLNSGYFNSYVHVKASDNVSLVRCRVEPWRVFGALRVEGSRVASANSLYRAGHSFDCYAAGTGILVYGGSFLFDSASTAMGGEGESYSCSVSYCQADGCGTDGGNGVALNGFVPVNEMELLGTVLSGGTGGVGEMWDTYACYPIGPCNGDDGHAYSLASGNLVPTFVGGTPRGSDYASTVLEGASLDLSLKGEIGDSVSLLLSKTPLFDATAPGVGVRLVGSPVTDPSIYREISLGTLTASTQHKTATFPLEAFIFEHATWFAQVVFTDLNNQAWYGPGCTLTVLDTPEFMEYPSLCNGDGGDQAGCTNCPCMNNAPTGTIGGCLNGHGLAARIRATGDPSVSLPSGTSTDLRFGARHLAPFSLCTLISGSAVAPLNSANPCFGLNQGVQGNAFDGLRCAVASPLRLGLRSANALGDVGTTTSPFGGESWPPPGIAGELGLAPGSTRYFQLIYRDNALASCGTGRNTSQAVEVTFTP